MTVPVVKQEPEILNSHTKQNKALTIIVCLCRLPVMRYNEAVGNGDDAASRRRADFMQRMKVDQALFISLIVQRQMV